MRCTPSTQKRKTKNEKKHTKTRNWLLIKFRLSCVPSAPTYSHRRCMEMINNQQADVAMLEVSECV